MNDTGYIMKIIKKSRAKRYFFYYYLETNGQNYTIIPTYCFCALFYEVGLVCQKIIKM